jgi:hypothetical protein
MDTRRDEEKEIKVLEKFGRGKSFEDDFTSE